jgi:RND superfamily putative drug exporter
MAGSNISVFRRLASFSLRHRRSVLVAAGLFCVIAGVLGVGVTRELSEGGFDAPSEQAVHAAAVLQSEFHTGDSNFFVLVTARHGTMSDPSVAQAGRLLTERLAHAHGIANVQSYWSLGEVGALANPSHTQALIVGRILGNQNQIVANEPSIASRFDRVPGAVSVQIGGFAASFHEIDVEAERGLIVAELIAVPITFVLLLLVYGSVIAALLPLVIGGVTVLGTLFLLRVLATFTTVSVFAENLTTALGLGLAIDYSLFLVSRYREELAAGYPSDEAVRRTVQTAGRTVICSSITVAGALSAMLVFPIVFLRSFAYTGIAVALLTGAAAVVVLPALLGILGPRVNALTVWRRSVTPSDEGFWSRVATAVMRRPVVVLIATLGLLAVLASPFLGLKLGYLDYRVLSPGDSVRQVNDLVVKDFGVGQTEPIEVVAATLPGTPGSPTRSDAIDGYAARLSRLDGVHSVAASTGVFVLGNRLPAPPAYLAQFSNNRGAWFDVIPQDQALSSGGAALVRAIRDTPAPAPVLVGGSPAAFVDSTGVIDHDLPVVLVLISLVTLLVLLVMFKSVLIACKALVLNLLSLSAMFGAMVWVFQDGHLSGLLNFTATGNLAATTPILMFCVAFGLSMDYEVFLISRIKEQHDAGYDNETAVSRGLQRTGRIITAAALLISVVFLGLVTSGISSIKLFGLGLTLAVLMDAFVVRGLLVPAFMRLAGRANWWMPRWVSAPRRPAPLPYPVGASATSDEPQPVGALL